MAEGIQPPFTQTQSDPGFTVVQPPVDGVDGGGGAGARLGGSQLPLIQTQSEAGRVVLHDPLLGCCTGGLLDGWDTTPFIPGGSHPPFTQSQSGAG